MSKPPRNDEQIWNVGNIKNKKKMTMGKRVMWKKWNCGGHWQGKAKCLNQGGWDRKDML
jgi:hypothetical protein